MTPESYHQMIESENFRSFPCLDLLSRYFHFGVFEIFVSSLFLLVFLPFGIVDNQYITFNQQFLKNKAMKKVSAFFLCSLSKIIIYSLV